MPVVPPAASPFGLAIDTRQSVDTAKDFSSCDAQFQTCLDCARAFGDRDGEWIGERFDDQSWSGSSVERPALKRLRQAVRKGRLLRHIIASFAEFERALIAARLSDTTMSLKAHSRRLAGPPPYGYGADSKSKQLVPNAREARRLQAILEMAASGVRPSEIAHRVNKSFARNRISGCVRTRSLTALPAISLRSPASPLVRSEVWIRWRD